MMKSSRVKNGKAAKKRKLIIFGISAVIILILLLAFQFFPSTHPEKSARETVVVSASSSRSEILNTLYRDGYITNRLSYYFLYISSFLSNNIRAGGYLLSKGMNALELYQNLANPYLRYVRIDAGLRKEEIADIYGNLLAWNDQQKEDFLNSTSKTTSTNFEGYYFPETYLVSINATGKEVRQEMINKFNQKVVPAKLKPAKRIVNLDTAVKIASIIQREAAGSQDMNLISGIIWNRIFNGMSLDMDATLQYAKGSNENGWWPQVLAKDKKINSPYNTYKNKGLPPSAISNPGLSAINAAFNPESTNCIFYLHDKNRNIHCSKTYEEHVAKIEQYLR